MKLSKKKNLSYQVSDFKILESETTEKLNWNHLIMKDQDDKNIRDSLPVYKLKKKNIKGGRDSLGIKNAGEALVQLLTRSTVAASETGVKGAQSVSAAVGIGKKVLESTERKIGAVTNSAFNAATVGIDIGKEGLDTTKSIIKGFGSLAKSTSYQAEKLASKSSSRTQGIIKTEENRAIMEAEKIKRYLAEQNQKNKIRFERAQLKQELESSKLVSNSIKNRQKLIINETTQKINQVSSTVLEQFENLINIICNYFSYTLLKLMSSCSDKTSKIQIILSQNKYLRYISNIKLNLKNKILSSFQENNFYRFNTNVQTELQKLSNINDQILNVISKLVELFINKKNNSNLFIQTFERLNNELYSIISNANPNANYISNI